MTARRWSARSRWPRSSSPSSPAGDSARPRGRSRGIHKIRHVVMIMQENRSFDSFFGTFPGADGIPMKNGVPTVCVPDPCARAAACGRTTTPPTGTSGGPHDHVDAVRDIDRGKMDGFIKSAQVGRQLACVAHFDAPACSLAPSDAATVMGYHDQREIPNYWAWAKAFVLQDHMFESDTSWSLPVHLYMVSGWSAKCSKKGDPMSCRPRSRRRARRPASRRTRPGAIPDYAWTDLT